MQENPLVSVVLPIFNTEKYVAEAIESVLNQTYKNIEIICIDDGSTDSSLQIIRSYGDRVRVLMHEQNGGIGKGRNTGIAAVEGEFIAFIDADDIWVETKLEKQLRAFEQDASLDICFTHMNSFISPELPEEVKRMRYCPADPTPGRLGGTVLFKRDVAERVGPFSESVRVGEFIDWYARAQELGIKSIMLDDVLYRRRIHATNTGVNERASRANYLKIVRDALSRRRQK